MNDGITINSWQDNNYLLACTGKKTKVDEVRFGENIKLK